MKFKNFTPHPVNVYADEKMILSIPVEVDSEGKKIQVRVSEGTENLPPIEGIPVVKKSYGDVVGLPAPQDGVMLIVSVVVLAALQGKRFITLGLGCAAFQGKLSQALGVKEKLMTIRIFAIFFSTLIFATFAHAQEGTLERSDWKKFFDDYQAKGTIVVADERQADRILSVFDQARATKRYSPASTFKIPHTLFALDVGAVRDEFQVFRWDGIKRSFAGHNQDQNLRSAMRNSTVWVYELFAREIGEEKAKRYLKQIGYGNADPSTSKGDYWIDGTLEISAYEQISFLRKLYRNELPFRVEHQRLVKDLMITEAGRNWILRAKTGWEGRFGWWVGWVEWPTGAVFFALNIDTPNRMDDLFKREAIVRAILHSIDALPPN